MPISRTPRRTYDTDPEVRQVSAARARQVGGGRKVRGTGGGQASAIEAAGGQDEYDRIMREEFGRNYERRGDRRHGVVARSADVDRSVTPGQVARGARGAARKAGRQTLPSAAGSIPVVRGAAGVTVDDGAGFILGCILFALTRAYLQGGTSEARQWLAAKFLNRAGSPAGAQSAGDASKTAPTAPSYQVNPGTTPAFTYPAGQWQATAPTPGNFQATTAGGAK